MSGLHQAHEELIRITIDLGSGRTEDIIVNKGEEHQSLALAERFCQSHGFDKKIEYVLAE